MVRYHVKLTREEVEQLKAIANKGTHTSHTFKVAYILLNCDEGEYSDKNIAQTFWGNLVHETLQPGHIR